MPPWFLSIVSPFAAMPRPYGRAVWSAIAALALAVAFAITCHRVIGPLIPPHPPRLHLGLDDACLGKRDGPRSLRDRRLGCWHSDRSHSAMALQLLDSSSA